VVKVLFRIAGFLYHVLYVWPFLKIKTKGNNLMNVESNFVVEVVFVGAGNEHVTLT